MEAAKTLSEMSASERREFIDTVADALEYKAEEAIDTGHLRAAANNRNLASAIRGITSEPTSADLASAELLLQIGINYCVASEPPPTSRLLH